MMSLCTQESFDALAFEKGIEELHQELLDAAASVDDSHPPPTPANKLKSSQFMAIRDSDIVTPHMRSGAQAVHTNRPVDERRDIYMSHKFHDLLPSASHMYPSLVTDHASRSYWNAPNPSSQARTHVTPQEVEPRAGTYRTWKQPVVALKPTKGIMEMVIDGGYHSSTQDPFTMPSIESVPPATPPPSPAPFSRPRTATARPGPVKRKAKFTHKKTSVSKAKATLTGRFPCPSNCGHVCKSRGDLRRHLQSLAHQAASFPCTNDCGKLFTRQDAAERHARGRGCPRR